MAEGRAHPFTAGSKLRVFFIVFLKKSFGPFKLLRLLDAICTLGVVRVTAMPDGDPEAGAMLADRIGHGQPTVYIFDLGMIWTVFPLAVRATRCANLCAKVRLSVCFFWF